MRWLKFLLMTGGIAFTLTLEPSVAHARCCACDPTDNEAAEASRVISTLQSHVTNEHNRTRQQITDFENRLMNWLDNWWDNEFRPSLEDFAEHISVQLIEHARIMGTLFDAQNLVLVQKTLQEQHLIAGRRYRPHEYACVAGSVVQGLPRAKYAAQAMRKTLNEDALARSAFHVRSGNTLDFSMAQDQTWRWEEFLLHFCDPEQNVDHMPAACGTGGWTYRNGDILVGEVLLDNPTIETEEELRTALALSRNLIEPRITMPVPETSLDGPTGKQAFMERRSIQARRQVAQDVLSSIIARRMPSNQTRSEIRDLMLHIGLPQNEFPANWNPSYNELMDVITKRRFWDPQYFVRLQTGPENVAREQAILSAFNLMQERENYEIMEHIGLMLAIQLSAAVEK